MKWGKLILWKLLLNIAHQAKIQVFAWRICQAPNSDFLLSYACNKKERLRETLGLPSRFFGTKIILWRSE